MKIVFSIMLVVFLFEAALAAEAVRSQLDEKTTENGYKRNDFCTSNAKKRLKELENQIGDEVKKVKQQQFELNQLNAKKNIINGFLELRDQFVTSLANIRRDKEEKDKVNIENFRNLLRSTLAIQAVSTLYNTTLLDPDPKKPVTVDSLCAAQENKDTSFCKHVGSFFITGGSIKKPLDQTLVNLRTAQGQLSDSDNKKMRSTFETVMKLPTNLSPEAVLDTLSKRAQTLTPLLSDDTKNDLASCINGDLNDSCKKLMTGNSRNDIRSLLKTEMSNVASSFAEARQGFVDSQLNNIYQTADHNEGEKHTSISNLFRTKLDAAIADFNDQSSKQKLAEIGVDDYTSEAFQKACSDPKSKDECNDKSTKLISFFESKMKDLNTEIETKTSGLNEVASTGGSLGKALKMRQYVAQKYLRSCPNTSVSDVQISNSVCSLLGGIARPSDEGAVSSLNGKMSEIVSRLLKDSPLSKTKGELGAFSKDELKVYENYCSGTTAGNNYQDICRDIYRESNAIKNVKESKEWAEFSNKYWIVPNDKSAKGYDVYEKKSNGRIFGEGLSQSVGSIYPMWLTNFTLTYQIENMTNQALFLKQLNYMYSPTSPWMANSYFQGSYYTFPASSNFATPFSTSAGFNFSK